ncbi:MAG TPA: AAA family ATPase [Micromonosporaceae bacterium]
MTGARTAGRRSGRGGFLRWVELDDAEADRSAYPFTLPVVAGLRAAGRLEFDPSVTFLIGDNGTGKSTLMEAIAVAGGFNPEGGSTNFRFATRSTESSLGAHLRLVRAVRKPRTGFFLRAESFYNVATEIERLNLQGAYGGRSLHERSHGEAFLELVRQRFGPDGLYLLDEPEAALSVHGCLAMLTLIHELAAAGSQFIVSTHSPILLAAPGARILQVGGEGSISAVTYDEAQPVAMTRSFLADPARYLHYLLTDPT